MTEAWPVLLVDDDEDVRMLVRLHLRREPRMVLCGEATTAAEAVALAHQHQPVLVILDHYIDGPTMGLEAAGELRAVAPAMKILLFTSHDVSAEVARQASVDALVSKDRIGDLLCAARDLLEVDEVVGDEVDGG